MTALPDDEYRRIAEDATPGPWEARTTGPGGGDHWYVLDANEAIAHVSAQDGVNEAEREPLATHIAMFDPPTVLALLDRAQAAEAAIQRVRDVHEPIDAAMYYGRAQSTIVKVCTGCGTDDGNFQRWPCPTIRALDPKETT